MGAFLIQRAESGHEILAVGLYHSAVGAQNLEPWLDLSSQGSVEMTWVVTPRPRPMTIPPNTHGAAMGYSDAAPYGAGGGIYLRGFLTPEGLHGAVGAQNLEPWLDLSSQGSVEMTLVVTSHPRKMTTPPQYPRRCHGLTYYAPVGGDQSESYSRRLAYQ